MVSGSDGDAIGAWADQEGTDDLTQATNSNKPTLKTGILNGKQVLRHDGSGDYLRGAFSATVSQPTTVFLVFELVTQSSGSTVGIYDSNSGNQFTLQQPSNSDWRILAGNSLGGGTADADAHISTALYNGTSSDHRIDGSSIASGDVGSNDLSGLTTGADVNASTNANVNMAELLVYDAKLSNSDRDDVEAYLQNKWGTPTLP